MDPDQYTWDHVFELERIAELIMKEAVKSNRRDLAAYVGRLRAFIVLTQARLILKLSKPRLLRRGGALDRYGF